VFCPFCNDPVPGPFPGSGEFLECSYCQQTFPFEPKATQTALLEYHEAEQRWMVVPIHTEMDVQTGRILDLCSRLAPGYIVHIMPVGPDSFRLRVKDGENVLIDSDVAFYTHELAANSDDELRILLEKVSHQRIKPR
jgi:hypothetical protein